METSILWFHFYSTHDRSHFLDYFPINHVGDAENETPSGSVDSKRRHHKILLIPTKNSSVCWFSSHRLHILNPTKCYNNKEQKTHRK